MSDTPGGNTNPRDRPRGPRSRKRNRRPPQGGGNPTEPRPPRDNRGPRRRRDRNRPRRENKPGPPPAAGKGLTLGQKLLRILTFGIVKPRPAAGPRPLRETAGSAPLKQSAPVPPSDPDAVTGTRLHVGNLHYDISESDLLDLFKGIGPVKSVDIVYNGRTHRSRGHGFVEFMSVADARRAVAELHGQPYMRRSLILGPARSRGTDEREADIPEEEP